ncbi:MAG: serine hydrolase [Gemmatimonadetes bacterium]|nr:serine hydrolase [Gemmatimonadota bacterium]
MRRLVPGLMLAVVGPLVEAQSTVGPDAKYAPLATRLSPFIEHEMKDKGLPALSVALVEGDRVVWARGYGYADSAGTIPATAQTVYRVGSVSKLFTDIGVMQLVERGVLDLDAPVTRYLPEFRPRNRFGGAITLRHLMSHRAGLVREPPVGNYFETSEPTLAATVASLNRTALVYKPGTRTKYSNAGIAVVGRVLENVQGQPFGAYLQRAILDPLGMTGASFAPTPRTAAAVSHALMWTRHGTSFAAPRFQLGMAPAGSMYATMPELGRFVSALFDGGAPVLRRETLEAMWVPQFSAPGATDGFGLGFMVGSLDGERMVRHGGAIYGFATELIALPGARLGVAVSAARDFTNGTVERIAMAVLRDAMAMQRGAVAATPRLTTSTTRERALALAGTYGSGERQVRLVARDTLLYLDPARGDMRLRLRVLSGDTLVVDDPATYGTVVVPVANGIVVDRDTLRRVDPAPARRVLPAHWNGLIGEYGWDHNVLYIHERDGRLTALIEWFAEYPLREVGPNEYAFPDYGLYAGERLRFTRDARGRATRVVAAEVTFARRKIPGEDAAVFRITPVKPVDELRRIALAATPPVERGTFRESDLVELAPLDPTIKLDVRYATRDNFLSVPVYTQARAFLQRPAAEALVRAHRALRAQGFGLLIHDGYRPWYVTKMFWDGTPEANHVFVADPSRGSRHNRGCAVDLTLYDLATGRPVRMTGGYDEMSDRSYPDYPGGTARQRELREILRTAMEAEGFLVYEAEWWHFDYKDWREYRIGNQRFEELGRR